MSDVASLQEAVLATPGVLRYWPADATNLGNELVAGDNATAQGGVVIGGATGAGDAMTATDFDGVDDRLATAWASNRNWCTNPKAGTLATTGWALGGTPTFVATNALPTLTGLPLGITTGFHVQAANNGDGVTFTWQTDNGAGWTVSLYAYLVALNGAARIELADGGGTAAHTTNNDNVNSRDTTVGSWIRLSLGFNATSTGTLTVKMRELTNATPYCDWYFTGVQIERTVGGAQSAFTVYFDGDSGGDAEWQGAANLSESGKGAFPQGSTRTFEGWANRDTNTTNDTLIGSAAANANNAVWLALKDANPEDVQFRAQVGGAKVTWTNAWPGEAQWVHWMLRATLGTSAQLIINGVDKGSLTLSNKPQDSLAGTLSIADYKSVTGDPFDGKQAHVAAYRGDATAYALSHYGWGLSTAASRAPLFGLPSTSNFPSPANLPTGETLGVL